MKIREITSYLETIAPLNYQESYDNSGLIIGDENKEINKALISLDCTERVVEEAIEKGCGLIISHHPLVFSGLKRFTGKTYVERTVIKAIKNDIAIYAIHTNLDNVYGGVSSMMADRISLVNQAILRPKRGMLKKLEVYVPVNSADALRDALFSAGAGNISNYDECSFNLQGKGTFRPLQGANPAVGSHGVREHTEEIKIEIIYPSHIERQVLVAMYAAHPYEEVAHQIYTIENNLPLVGSGVIGNLENPVTEEAFLAELKDKFKLRVIRHTAFLDRKIQRVALCGGAGGFLLNDAIRSGADIFITADYKYHEFFDAEGKILIADIGHFESEQFTQELLLEIIRKKFANFAVLLTEIDTNPLKYY